MDVREKLVELLNNSFAEQYEKRGLLTAPHTATDLIAHGVTVQECKIGDKVYQVDGARTYESTIKEITITAKHTIFTTENIAFDERAIGKSIFLSLTEAAALLPQPPKGE